jgi:Spy/CpxP family protein refolding chaperone
MISTRWRSMAMAPALVTCLAIAACGGESATTGSAAAPPPPVPAAPPPPPAPAPAAPEASAAPVVAPPPVNSQGPEMAEGEQHREHHHGGMLGLIMMSLPDLGLSADQQTAVDKIRADLATKTEPARAAGKDFAGVLADGVAAGKVDRAKIDPAITKLVTQVQAVHDVSLTAIDQLHDILTPPQRAKLVDELQAHWEKWKDAHGHDEADDKQHRSGHLLALVRELGLSQEQADKIKASFHDKMKASPQDQAHKEVQDHLTAFGTAFKAEKFDAKKVTGSKAAAHMARWGATRMARFVEAATPVLTPEQRTKLADEIRERANRSES